METSPRVMNMVRRRILEDPTVTNDVLYAAAIEMEPEMRDLNLRQFNARYPLQVRRWELSTRTKALKPKLPLSKAAVTAADAAARARPGDGARPMLMAEASTSPASTSPTGPSLSRAKVRPGLLQTSSRSGVSDRARREIRKTLIRFAESIAQAESIPGAIRAMSSIDEVVDEICSALS